MRVLGIEFLSIRKFRTRKRVESCYPRGGIDFIKDRLDVVHGSRCVIIQVGGNNIRNRNETFKRSKVVLKKFKELLVR